MTVDTQPAVKNRLRTLVGETLGKIGDWTHAEPSEGSPIALEEGALQADGETVSKFGPYESTDELEAQLGTVLTSDVFYTVCCDG